MVIQEENKFLSPFTSLNCFIYERIKVLLKRDSILVHILKLCIII